jgi:hypothetical protein
MGDRQKTSTPPPWYWKEEEVGSHGVRGGPVGSAIMIDSISDSKCQFTRVSSGLSQSYVRADLGDPLLPFSSNIEGSISFDDDSIAIWVRVVLQRE